ncbi:peptidoglycan-binding protein [Streptomyces sp. NPDC046203]|uniref:peptidoglycan-binding domain-containing protein n=1 Tax=Streptomyces sp. NPDC046203 TaxID=3154602 RepID=UPI0033F8932F
MFKKPASRVVAAVSAAAALSVLAFSGTAQARVGAPYIGYGQTNNPNGVWCVQHQLNFLFANNWNWRPGVTPHRQISEDSKFGPETDEAIRFFQKAYFPWQVDGIVGPESGYALLWDGDPVYGYDEKVTKAGYCNTYIPSIV